MPGPLSDLPPEPRSVAVFPFRVTTDDEIHELADAFNRMAAVVEETARIRRDFARGFDGVYLHEVGPQQERFIEAFGRDVLPRVR